MFDRRARIDLMPERRELGIVFQSYAVWPHMTVARERRLSVEGARSCERPRARARVDKMLDMVGLSAPQRQAGDAAVSGGQQQRVALARALVHEPRLVLFDEPMSNLDAQLREQMRMELKVLQERLGFTAIYVTHDQAEAFALAETVVVMNRGRIETIGTPREVFQRPRTPFVARFLGLNVCPGRLVAADVAAGRKARRYAQVALADGLPLWGVLGDVRPPERRAGVACMRKEHIASGRAGGRAALAADATVRRTTFAGPIAQHRSSGSTRNTYRSRPGSNCAHPVRAAVASGDASSPRSGRDCMSSRETAGRCTRDPSNRSTAAAKRAITPGARMRRIRSGCGRLLPPHLPPHRRPLLGAQDVPACKGAPRGGEGAILGADRGRQEGGRAHLSGHGHPARDQRRADRRVPQMIRPAESFKVNYALSATGALVTRVEQEIGADRVTIDIAAVGSPPWVFERADKGDALEYDSPQYSTTRRRSRTGSASTKFAFNGAYMFVPMWDADKHELQGKILEGRDRRRAGRPDQHRRRGKSVAYLATYVGPETSGRRNTSTSSPR